MENNQIDTVDIDDVLEADNQITKKVGIVFGEDGEPTVAFIIVGKDSDQYRACASRLRSNGIRRQANKRTRIDTKTEEGALEFGRVLEENEFELAVSVVVGFYGFTNKGREIDFSSEIVRKLFTAKPSWREKVSAELEAEEGFLKLSSANSAISRAANLSSVE